MPQNLYKAVILGFLWYVIQEGSLLRRAFKIEYQTVQGFRCKAFSAYLPALSEGMEKRFGGHGHVGRTG
jgi:hypothetical protein